MEAKQQTEQMRMTPTRRGAATRESFLTPADRVSQQGENQSPNIQI